MRLRNFVVATMCLLALGVVSGCGKADPGEQCDSHSDCDDGLVCGKPYNDAAGFACLYICRDDKDCPAGSECKGVEATDVKGCRVGK
jgi:hypothetical protein